MKRNIYYIIFVCITTFTSCIFNPPDLYNKIEFEEGVEISAVRDSIIALEKILDSYSNSKILKFYVDFHGILHIDSSSIASWKIISSNQDIINRIDNLAHFSQHDRNRLFSIMTFLYENDIDGFHYNDRHRVYIFTYKIPEVWEPDMYVRFFLIKRHFDSSFYYSYVKIDESDSLMLVAPSYYRKYQKFINEN